MKSTNSTQVLTLTTGASAESMASLIDRSRQVLSANRDSLVEKEESNRIIERAITS